MSNLKFRIFTTPEELGEHIANKVLEAFKAKGNKFVLGIPWGSSPIPFFNVFTGLVKRHNIDLSEMHVIMMDEYVIKDKNGYSYAPEGPYSGHYKIKNDFLVKLPSEQAQKIKIHFPNPINPENFDKFIESLGGVDLFLVAAGAEDGHVAMCGPGTNLNSRTRILELPVTIRDYNFEKYRDAFNNDINNVPTHGISIGLQTILDSKKLLFIAHGSEKARIVEILFNSKKFDQQYPITFLWNVLEKVELCVDKAAAENVVNLIQGE